MLKSLISMAILAFARADDSVVTYASTLKCGACVKGGFVFCFQGADGDTYTSAAPTNKCCQDTSCSEYSDNTYNCSAAYSDKEYALSFCPQPQNVCGTNQSVEF
jgi:hypothetical protein